MGLEIIGDIVENVSAQLMLYNQGQLFLWHLNAELIHIFTLKALSKDFQLMLF